jgi:radical SAM protein with 4Fe4S-binding SPASM domain
MKKFKISTLAAIAVYAMLAAGLSSCGSEPQSTKPIEMGNVYENEIIVFDSCEYIKWRTYNGYYNLTHKGNCKYCRLRQPCH